MDYQRKRPLLTLTVTQESKDSIELLSSIAGISKGAFVDKLVSMLLTKFDREEVIELLIEGREE